LIKASLEAGLDDLGDNFKDFESEFPADFFDDESRSGDFKAVAVDLTAFLGTLTAFADVDADDFLLVEGIPVGKVAYDCI
jgi:hypothetical protein